MDTTITHLGHTSYGHGCITIGFMHHAETNRRSLEVASNLSYPEITQGGIIGKVHDPNFAIWVNIVVATEMVPTLPT